MIVRRRPPLQFVTSPQLITTLALGFVLFGCVKPANDADAAAKDKPSEAKEQPAESPPAEPVASADLLTLGAAKIMRVGHEDRAIELLASGPVTLAGTPFGTISPDGQLFAPDGALMMTVHPDGTVSSADGPTGIVLEQTGGSLTLPKLSVRVQFAADGAIATETSGPNAVLLGTDPPALRSEGCTGPVTKTCALITLSYLMALGNPDSVQEDAAP
ncbi:hypothetical protein DB30_05362 [Enhygromyxa salina]|uniref:Uncharacterized protein n=1 Tax=Enhygromyxa salina TaxID=215803 RepID=A0A0C1ZD44_9BACT|nr:hypothetical protein [Enhygromyxa salina]KIG15614.1 hypothetical protein DB30_05362 [Enhygromyxa salina]